MINLLSVYAVIPARGGSRRLPRKNIATVWGKPMLYWSIRACQQSSYIDKCFVSTEDPQIAEIGKSFGAEVIRRPAELADDATFKQDVIVHAAKEFEKKPDIVVSLQPNSPEVCARDLDAAIQRLVVSGRNEIFSVNKELIQNAAFRVMKYGYVFQKSLSTHSGVYVTSYIDAHTATDVQLLERERHPCDDEAKEARDA